MMKQNYIILLTLTLALCNTGCGEPSESVSFAHYESGTLLTEIKNVTTLDTLEEQQINEILFDRLERIHREMQCE